MSRAPSTRDTLLSTFAVVAVAETAWTVYLGVSLPRHYVANHWDLAWVGMDAAQVAVLLLAAWAAWRRRAVLIVFACASGTLLLVDAWFDVTTARYSDVDQSLWSLVVELPLAAMMFWVARRIYLRLVSASVTEDRRSRATLHSGWGTRDAPPED
ncbi:MAG TPA: hypothetical protein VND83_07425 [Acidimicrobiales bacterium]|nr:hypothetical protein [Acidimicrobiales bacterium]